MFLYPDRNANGPTIVEALGALKDEHSEGIVFYADDLSQKLVSFAEIYARVVDSAQNLLTKGLKPGERVGIVIPNPEEFVISFLGVLAVRAVPVPMYPPFSLGKLDAYIQNAAAILQKSRASLLITDSKMQRVLWSLVDRVESLERVIEYRDMAKPSRTENFVPPAVDLDEIAFLQFTSGSTSAPKGVVITHRALLANMDAFMRAYEIGPGDKALSWLPLFHDLGLIGFVLATCWYGLPTVIIPTALFVRRPSLWMQAMHDHQATISCAPNFAFALATRRTPADVRDGLDLSRVRMLGCGAEPTHPDTIDSFLKHFESCGLEPECMVSVYGLAENVLGVSYSPLREPLKVDSVDRDTYLNEGRALPSMEAESLRYVSVGFTYEGFEIQVIDEEGRPLADRSVGEVLVKGPSIAAGYFEDSFASAEAFTPAGLKTGDMGYLVGGELFLTGRKKDTIIINGRNYDPQSIEWVVQEVDGVRKGNVVAFSVLAENSESLVVVAETRSRLDEEELKRSVITNVRQEIGLSLGDIVFLEAGTLPKTSSGKLQRSKTKDAYLKSELGSEGKRTLGAQADINVLARHLAGSAYSRVKAGMRRRAGGQ